MNSQCDKREIREKEKPLSPFSRFSNFFRKKFVSHLSLGMDLLSRVEESCNSEGKNFLPQDSADDSKKAEVEMVRDGADEEAGGKLSATTFCRDHLFCLSSACSIIFEYVKFKAWFLVVMAFRKNYT